MTEQNAGGECRYSKFQIAASERMPALYRMEMGSFVVVSNARGRPRK